MSTRATNALSAVAEALDDLDVPMPPTIDVLLRARAELFEGMKQLPLGDTASGNVFAHTIGVLDDLIVEQLRGARGAPIKLVSP